MSIIGIGVDYSNICKDYNTAYLDRDNNDPATSKCMKQVLSWTKAFVTELLENFEYQVHNFSSSTPAKIDDIASKRFLFYSLEKEITLQSYVMDNKYIEYGSASAWKEENNDSILVKNDEDGGLISFFMKENSEAHLWLVDKLKDFSIDEIEFSAK